MSDKLRRYDVGRMSMLAGMLEDPSGDWCKWEDVEKLEAERDALLFQNRELAGQAVLASEQSDKYEEESGKLQAENEALLKERVELLSVMSLLRLHRNQAEEVPVPSALLNREYVCLEKRESHVAEFQELMREIKSDLEPNGPK